jgi:restriction endonuclease Mrr
MPISDFQTLMLPLLEVLAQGGERSMREATNLLADRFHLTVGVATTQVSEL